MSKSPKSKVVTVEQAMEHCHDGMTIMLPGFVNCGVPQTLIEGLMKAGIKDLHVISNNTSVKGKGIGKLVHDNRIKHLTCSHIGNNTETVEKVVAGEINITFVPQGSICEKVRAGGAGIAAGAPSGGHRLQHGALDLRLRGECKGGKVHLLFRAHAHRHGEVKIESLRLRRGRRRRAAHRRGRTRHGIAQIGALAVLQRRFIRFRW